MTRSLLHRDRAGNGAGHAALPACSGDELDAIHRNSTCTNFDAGTVLCREGRMGREAFFVLAGTVTVSRDGAELARVGAGEFVGEVALLEGRPRTATVTTVTPITALVFNRSEFSRLLHAAPALVERMNAALVRRQAPQYSPDSIRRISAAWLKRSSSGVASVRP